LSSSACWRWPWPLLSQLLLPRCVLSPPGAEFLAPKQRRHPFAAPPFHVACPLCTQTYKQKHGRFPWATSSDTLEWDDSAVAADLAATESQA
jgi:hypothetical protein